MWSAFAVALGGAVAGAGCIDELTDETQLAASCGADPAPYTPYTASFHPSGPVSELPWREAGSIYPDGNENFRGYDEFPSTIECGSDKGAQSHLDVTSGCLVAASTGGGKYTRGFVELTASDAFRVVAHGFSPAYPTRPVKWTDQSVGYRFYFYGETGGGAYPGFKAFARYRTEDDLYVASWRTDGVVQIQKKHCGTYTTLARREDLPPPQPRTWHRMRLDALGDELTLYLDGKQVLSATSGTFSWGTAGIRIDGMRDAFLDDWQITDPAL